MLHLRLSAGPDRAATLEQALLRTEGLIGLTSVPMAGAPGTGRSALAYA